MKKLINISIDRRQYSASDTGNALPPGKPRKGNHGRYLKNLYDCMIGERVEHLSAIKLKRTDTTFDLSRSGKWSWGEEEIGFYEGGRRGFI